MRCERLFHLQLSSRSKEKKEKKKTNQPKMPAGWLLLMPHKHSVHQLPRRDPAFPAGTKSSAKRPGLCHRNQTDTVQTVQRATQIMYARL